MAKNYLKVPVLDTNGAKKGEIELPKEIFGLKPNRILVSQAVRVYLSNQRKGTASTKTRGDVRGSGKKIYKQKGTGQARHGDRYAPIFVGGGVAFGPKPKDWSLKLSKNMKKQALFSALSLRCQNGEIIVIDSLDKIQTKTKDLLEILAKLKLKVKKSQLQELVLLGTEEKIEKLYLSGRNLAKLKILPANLLNTYEVLNAKRLVLTKKAVETISKTFLQK